MTILIDSHVHLYSNFRYQKVFQSAIANFDVWGSNISTDLDRVLFLTEGSNEDAFKTLLNWSDSNNDYRSWNLLRTKEDCSLLVNNKKSQSLFIISGRQIVTSEGLEVLALGTTKFFKDGLPLQDLVEEIRMSNSLPVLPWGFGKWFGSRGKLIEDYLNIYGDKRPLFLGDNGNRIKYFPQPRPFRFKESKGISILPGSDPLPFSSEETRIGSFGFMIDGRLAVEQPAVSLYNKLTQPDLKTISFGKLENPVRFFLKQVAMQLYKVMRKR